MGLRFLAVMACALGVSVGAGAPAEATPLPIVKGAQVDVNVANISGDFADVVNPDSRTSWGGGLFVIIPLQPEFGIQTGLLYTGRGAKSTHGSITLDGHVLPQGTTTFELNYLEAPILARFTFKGSGKVRPALLAGVEASVITSSQVSTDVSGGTAKVDLNTEDFDFGLCLGGGLEIGAGKGKVLLDARYTWGLTDVYNAVNISQDENRTWTFSLGYGF